MSSQDASQSDERQAKGVHEETGKLYEPCGHITSPQGTKTTRGTTKTCDPREERLYRAGMCK